MGKDIEARGSNGMDNVDALCGEIGSKRFDEDVGCFLLDFGNGRGDMGGTTVDQV